MKKLVIMSEKLKRLRKIYLQKSSIYCFNKNKDFKYGITTFKSILIIYSEDVCGLNILDSLFYVFAQVFF